MNFPTREKKNVRSLALLLPALALATAAHAADVETVKVTIHGGKNAGTYEKSTASGGCTYGFAGPGSWGNQLSDAKDKDPKKFNSLQLVVPDAKKAASGSQEFLLTVGFGPLLARSAEYKVDTRASAPKKSGSGTVTVHDAGNTAKVDFSVATADGVRIEGTIDCHRVMRNGA
jgi:hypothetical protein